MHTVPYDACAKSQCLMRLCMQKQSSMIFTVSRHVEGDLRVRSTDGASSIRDHHREQGSVVCRAAICLG
jgi:hypothetical protein